MLNLVKHRDRKSYCLHVKEVLLKKYCILFPLNSHTFLLLTAASGSSVSPVCIPISELLEGFWAIVE